tara:strand:+ start:108 stop:221 length:114 start_codon:yes stop_codon:yes gene_type:complete
MKQRLEKWWDQFVSLKWWVQAVIIVIAVLLIHSFVMH